jgi:mRNA interferase YafQ
MLVPDYSGQFKRDYKLAMKRRMDIALIDCVIKKLINEVPLDEKFNDHALSGNFKGYRECHLKPDWLLIYRVDADSRIIYFLRTGTHSDLF